MDLLIIRRKVLEPLRLMMPSVDTSRIESSYQDLLDIIEVSDEIGNSFAERDPFVLSDAGRDDEAREVIQRQRYMVTLLKTVYVFADIFISTVLHEISYRPKGGMSLNSFLKNQNPPIFLSLESILPAYSAVTYRNKIIVHQDFQRMYSYEQASDGRFRFAPLPSQLHISKEDAETLQRLREVYKSTIPGLFTENNQFMLLRLLFYNIPIKIEHSKHINKDREEINKIAERGGCPSMSRDDLLMAVDRFAMAVVDSIK